MRFSFTVRWRVLKPLKIRRCGFRSKIFAGRSERVSTVSSTITLTFDTLCHTVAFHMDLMFCPSIIFTISTNPTTLVHHKTLLSTRGGVARFMRLFVRSCGVVVITSALHAEGLRFNPGHEQSIFSVSLSSQSRQHVWTIGRNPSACLWRIPLSISIEFV